MLLDELLDEQTWRRRMSAHESRVDDLVTPHLARRERGERHPVEDFLFTYYSYRPAHLRRWHPGAGVTLRGDTPHAGWREYLQTPTGTSVDPLFVAKRLPTVQWINRLLRATESRPAFTGCLGLHEWAMVYHSSPSDVRHAGVPLRLGHRRTDDVVEAHQIRCTHFDAFRFFTEDARPRNTVQPDRPQQVALEQPGCLHTGMDLYKWAYKLSPLVSSELVVEAFILAREIRELDMRASPYDLTSYGYQPVRIETRAGKAEYIAAQRHFAERAAAMRSNLIATINDAVRDHAPHLERALSPGRAPGGQPQES